MIFDRTQNDVDAAIRLRAEKVQTFQELSASDVETLERGLITINTLNRIENKQDELKSLINALGYWNTNITNKTWNETQIFDIVEFQRIVDNTNILRTAFFTYNDTPNTPGVSYYYEDINSLEKILNDLDVMINDVKSRYRQCGTFQCGEVNQN